MEISRWGEILARYIRPYVNSSHLPPHLVKSNADRWDLRGGGRLLFEKAVKESLEVFA